MTREEMVEYIVREARVAANQMLDKSEPVHLFDFGVMKKELGEGSVSCLIVIGETKLLEAWGTLIKTLPEKAAEKVSGGARNC